MKKLLILIIAIFSIIHVSIATAAQTQSISIQEKLDHIEKQFDGKIGVYAIDTTNNQTIGFRANERFPVQSTFKLIGAAALLKASSKNKNLLQEKIHYTKNDLLFWHPVTGQHIASGMTFEELTEATISYSDNPAINLIMKKLGGPKAITAYARTIGNKTFNIEHYEGELNSNPQNNSDTSTPKDMALSLQQLTLGNVLAKSHREKLITWMRNNTTGYTRIRAGAPAGWVVAEKTGAGDYGISNDIGILWSPTCKPVVLAIYTVQNKQDAKRRDDIVVAATSAILNEFAKKNDCFQKLLA